MTGRHAQNKRVSIQCGLEHTHSHGVCVCANLVALERLGQLFQGSCSVLSPDNQFGYHRIIVFTDFIPCVWVGRGGGGYVCVCVWVGRGECVCVGRGGVCMCVWEGGWRVCVCVGRGVEGVYVERGMVGVCVCCEETLREKSALCVTAHDVHALSHLA